MKRVTQWSVDDNRCIRGQCEGRFVITSPVMKIEGKVVTTRSGSNYHLAEQNDFLKEDQLEQLGRMLQERANRETTNG